MFVRMTRERRNDMHEACLEHLVQSSICHNIEITLTIQVIVGDHGWTITGVQYVCVDIYNQYYKYQMIVDVHK